MSRSKGVSNMHKYHKFPMGGASSPTPQHLAQSEVPV